MPTTDETMTVTVLSRTTMSMRWGGTRLKRRRIVNPLLRPATGSRRWRCCAAAGCRDRI